MRIIVFGASHGLGREVVKRALHLDIPVKAFSRAPERIGLSHPQLALSPGDVLDEKAVAGAIKGCDAAICTLGLPTRQAIGPPISRRSYVLSKGTANIIAGLQRYQVRRFICETAIGSAASVRDCTVLARLSFRLGLRWLFRQKDEQEALVRKSGLDWTLVRPSALSNGPYTGRYLVAAHTPVGILTHVSRSDVAEYMVQAIGNPDTVGKALTVTYPPRFGDSLRWIRNYRG